MISLSSQNSRISLRRLDSCDIRISRTLRMRRISNGSRVRHDWLFSVIRIIGPSSNISRVRMSRRSSLTDIAGVTILLEVLASLRV